jgi:hypothetical protein
MAADEGRKRERETGEEKWRKEKEESARRVKGLCEYCVLWVGNQLNYQSVKGAFRLITYERTTMQRDGRGRELNGESNEL